MIKVKAEYVVPYTLYSVKLMPTNSDVKPRLSTLRRGCGELIRQVMIGRKKMIIHPLSMLTEEIEHNGEEFVPIERLESSLSGYFDFSTHPMNYPNHLFIMLLEWQFDVFGLIPKGLAIEKD